MRAPQELITSSEMIAEVIGKWRRPQGFRRAIAIVTVLALLAGTGAVVYTTGGTRYAYLHVAYIPIIFGAVFFGLRGSVLTAVAATLVIGPWMPLNVMQGLSQPVMSWGVRGVFFLIFAAITGLLLELLNEENKAIRRIAYNDPQTRLPNQVALLSDLRQLLDRSGKSLSLFLIEIGRFGQLRATFGPEPLEALMQEAADRLRSAMSPDDKLYRVGPFQLAVVSACGTSGELQTLMRVLQPPATCEDIPIDLEARAGAACAPQHASSADELMKAASAALYRAQCGSSTTVTFDPQVGMQQMRSFALVSELRQALKDDELQLYYQPKIDLRSGRCLAAEALLRWPHKQHGFVPPGELIAYAEQTMLIDDITRWAVEKAASQTAAWRKQYPDFQTAVNLSARNLESGQLASDIRLVLEQCHLPPEALQVEITETAIMYDPERSAHVLQELKAIGISIAVDDFGAGQSSLTYLASLPVDEIKLDRALVSEINRKPRYDHVVCSAIELGHRLGMTVTAEGVEAEAIAERLKAHGCDLAQGFLFGRPMPAEDFVLWLEERGQKIAHREAIKARPVA